jgi:hypothetical protein
MFPDPDTCHAAVEVERTLALKCAERRALVVEATRRFRSTHHAAGAAVGQAGRLFQLRAGIARASFRGTLDLAGVIRRPA